MMLISEFYKNKELFITGGTGYLGKCLIEKLLRDCPDISKIYLLIRGKKNKTPLERMQEFSKDAVFARLHRERPNAFEKIIPIIGDSCELGLGISPADLERIKNVNIVVHGAANVRFDNVLRSSILMNTRGTYELLKLAVDFKKLLAFVHISTAYVNPMKYFLNEELVEAAVNWRTAIKMAETFRDEDLEVLRMKYTQFPNAYSFSKNLSEQVVADFADKLPVTILRPSIVTPSLKEPEPGFVDNINGPIGLLIAIATGFAQISYTDGDVKMAFIPVDTVTNITVLAAYRRGLETINSSKCGLDIRNVTPGKLYELTIYQLTRQIVRNVTKEPYENMFWTPNPVFTRNYYLFLMSIFLITVPLAIIYDGILMLNRKKKTFVKMTRTYVSTIKALEHFSLQYYELKNDRMLELVKLIPEKELDKFGDDMLMVRYEIPAISRSIRDGVRKYIFKQPLKTSPSARLHYNILYVLDKMVKILLFLFTIKVLWSICN